MNAARLGAVLLLSLPAGCAGSLLQSDAPPVQRYLLGPLPQTAAPSEAVTAALAIEVRGLSPGLATERVALIRDGRRFDYFAATAWPDGLGDVVADLLVKSLLNDGRFGAVSLQSAYASAGHLLRLTVLDFQAEYAAAAAPDAHVRLAAELIDVSRRRVQARYIGEARSRADDNTMMALMTAFERAFHDVAAQLADLTARELAAPPDQGGAG